MFDFLKDPLLTTAAADGVRTGRTLPGALAALVRGSAFSFSSLRPHQRHVWHAFLVQIAALALEKGKMKELPDEEAAWRRLLRRLTRMWPEGEPWSLVSADAEKPALFQAPVPGGVLPQGKTVPTPDGLDILITSKNHDLKAARMDRAAPEDWLFALVSLQTQQGIMGAGKYGISRMNGGYGARPLFGIDDPGNAGARFRRDTMALLSASEEDVNPHGLSRSGLALLWLRPWDGVQSISFHDLHPLYIEICRRVRLTADGGRITALDAPSKGPRISGMEDLKGHTGDPWTPVSLDRKSFTLSGEGFSSRKLAEVLNPAKYTLPICARISDEDDETGLSLLAQSVCRGQGKTQGYHERRVPLPECAVRLFKEDPEAFQEILTRRSDAVNDLRLALRSGLTVLAEAGQASGVQNKDGRRRVVEPAVERFDARCDATFFDDLWKEVATPEEARSPVFKTWLRSQVRTAQTVLEEIPRMLSSPSARWSWGLAQATLAFRGSLAKSATFRQISLIETFDGNVRAAQ